MNIDCLKIIYGFLIPYDPYRHTCHSLVHNNCVQGLQWIEKYQPAKTCRHSYCFYIALSRGYVDCTNYYLSKQIPIPILGYLNALSFRKMRRLKYHNLFDYSTYREKYTITKGVFNRMPLKDLMNHLSRLQLHSINIHTDDVNLIDQFVCKNSWSILVFCSHKKEYVDYITYSDLRLTASIPDGVYGMLKDLYKRREYHRIRHILDHNKEQSEIRCEIRCQEDIQLCKYSRKGCIPFIPINIHKSFVEHNTNPRVYSFLKFYDTREWLPGWSVDECVHITHIPNFKVFNYLYQLFMRKRTNVIRAYYIIMKHHFYDIPPEQRYISNGHFLCLSEFGVIEKCIVRKHMCMLLYYMKYIPSAFPKKIRKHSYILQHLYSLTGFEYEIVE